MDRMDSTRLELLKNKEEHAKSANASQEVREHLAGFIRSKQLQGSANQLTNNNGASSAGKKATTNNGATSSSFQASMSSQSVSCNNSAGHHTSSPGYMPASSHHHHDRRLADTMADDHPLRKTASMPTMHIPYKAQSLSRRRQMERRTTMSPLMKRKSRPRRQLLQSQDSNSTEYLSSNPCMTHNQLHKTDAGRSLSQSNSPPPTAYSLTVSYYNHLNHPQQQQQQSSNQPAQSSHTVGDATNDLAAISMTNFSTQPEHKTAESSSLSETTSKSFFTDSNNLAEREHSRDNVGDFSSSAHHQMAANDCSAFNVQLHKSSNRQQFQASPSNVLHPLSTSSSMKDNFAPQNQSSSSSSPLTRDNIAPADSSQALRQQHLKATEAIKRMQRASSRGKMIVGGSLDIEAPSISASRASSSRRNNMANYKDELRQWSLDGADLRTNGLLNRLQQPGGLSMGPAASSNLFNRDIYKLRMATTNDAASLRRSQSPSASILSGGNQMIGQQLQILQRTPIGAHGKLYSSSSSSTSSLLSQQDSLDDSSSQAIDLSSSSEASRQRSHNHHHHHHHHHHHQHLSQHHQQQTNQLAYTGRASENILSATGKSGPQPNVGQHYQKMLQDSFNNQLQLGQATNFEQLFMNSSRQQQPDMVAGSNPTHHPPSLLDASRTATSLDASYGSSNAGMFDSLADQFNLSASAQNLIMAQKDSQLACLNPSPMVVDQQQLSSSSSSANRQQQQQKPSQQDHTQWLMAYNNLLRSSADLQQANQVTSSLLDKIPEPYKTSIWSHLIRQHQQQLKLHQRRQQQRHLQTTLAAGGKGSSMYHREDQRLLINRTLSSPLLMSTTTSTGQQQDYQPAQLAARVSHLNNKLTDQRDRSQQATVMMQLDTLQLTDKEKMLESSGGCGLVTDNSSSGGADNNSIDLTLSSRSSDNSRRKSRFEASTGGHHDDDDDDDGAGGAGHHRRHHHRHHQQEQPLNFNYTPLNQEQALCKFIYNPVFDEHASTGIVYELEMCNHKCICANENNHPENSRRVLAIWRRLYEKGLMAKCARIRSREATFDEIQLCHSETYSYYFGKSPYERIKINRLDLSKLPIEGLTQLECGGQGADIDTAWNEEQTPGVARLAVGCVIEATLGVAEGKLMNAFAIVRPPGHHAEFQQAMGFCFFNSVSIAAKVLITRHHLARILIVDWDVHHGNGIQKMFYHDNTVMYISLHRHDKGNFFPGTGDSREIGVGSGEGYNWNIAWSSETMGDAEYVAAFRTIVMPIAREFNPSMILVACGFDAAQGHPFNFGGYDLSAACFAYMTRQLMTLANGRLVLCLEGGYQITAICDCAEACLRALLNESPGLGSSENDQHLIREGELRREPNHSACEVLYEVSGLAAKYWPSVEKWRHTIELSAIEAASQVR